MTDHRDDKSTVPWRLVYAGLAFAALAQIAAISLYFTDGGFAFPIGSFVTLVLTVMVAWFLRLRQKGRV